MVCLEADTAYDVRVVAFSTSAFDASADEDDLDFASATERTADATKVNPLPAKKSRGSAVHPVAKPTSR